MECFKQVVVEFFRHEGDGHKYGGVEGGEIGLEGAQRAKEGESGVGA